MEDRFWKLRPPAPTPSGELCSCPTNIPIVLTAAFAGLSGYNPLRCLRCNSEVGLEGLSLTTSQIDALAHWQLVHGAIEWLELDSGAYEAWARSQLLDPASASNMEGLQVARELNQVRTCFFWFFQPDADEEFEARSTCPICSGPLTTRTDIRSGLLLCEVDQVVLPGDPNLRRS